MADEQPKDDAATKNNPSSDETVPGKESTKDAPAEEPKEQGFGLSSYGNSAGNKIESALSPVGNPVGKGLATVVAPVGNIIGAAVDNGVMQAGRTAGGMTGKGAGGMDTEGTRKGWEEVKEEKRMEEEIGGREQTGENPLGL